MQARSPVATAAAAALVAAIVGGVVWGLIVKSTDYEVGIVAWAIGWLAGTAVVFAAGGSRGLPFQVVAVTAALLGILLGKYLSFVWVLEDSLAEVGLAVDVPIFSADTVDAFTEELGTVFGWFDLLWVGLAVYTAFRIPQPQSQGPAPADA
ncbi:MAG: hypothetical protein ACRDN6_15345 [Gaiellaceae bacterium]